LSAPLQKVLAEEVNVKKILMKSKLKNGIELDVVITPELRAEGMLREVARMAQELRQKAGLSPKDKIMLFIDAPAALRDVLKQQEASLRMDIGAKAVEYQRTEKFTAEEETKMDGEALWLALRKA